MIEGKMLIVFGYKMVIDYRQSSSKKKKKEKKLIDAIELN